MVIIISIVTILIGMLSGYLVIMDASMALLLAFLYHIIIISFALLLVLSDLSCIWRANLLNVQSVFGDRYVL